MGKFTEFKPHGRGLEKVLGGLESKIMDVLWSIGRATVRDVHERLRLGQDLAYTIVMTVMARLSTKGLLTREMVDGTLLDGGKDLDDSGDLRGGRLAGVLAIIVGLVAITLDLC